MNIISVFKDRLGHRSYQEFGKSIGISGDWINELSKKKEIKVTDISNLYKLCKALNISMEELIEHFNIEDNEEIQAEKSSNTTYINSECDDVGIIINEAKSLLEKEDIKINGKLLNNKAKQVCKDSLNTVMILTEQYL